MTSFSRRQIYSILIAALFWALTVTGFVFIPIQSAVEEPVYKEIRIQLAPMEEKQPAPEPVKAPEPVIEEVVAVVSEPASTPISEAPAPAAPAPAPKAAEPAPAPAAAKKAETAPSTPKTAEPAPAPAAKTPVPAAKTPVPEPEPAKQTIVKSIEQLMAEQAAARGTKKSIDAVEFDARVGESSTSSSSVSTGEKTFIAQQGPAISGQAAASAEDKGTGSVAVTGRTVNESVSSGTADSLGGISEAAANGMPAGTGVAGSAGASESGTSGSSSDGSGIEWGSGPGRRLINPSKPGISFSDEQKALITASVRDIRISFKVRPDGTVLRESIMIDKKASLPAAIFQAIERQISEWQFEKGSSDGQAVFLYSIIVE